MKVIIQAGGLGTRMLSLTENKPKTLIPVSNKPILFNIFDQFRSQADGFIVIGDYKYEVLDRYLLTFAKNENYILIPVSYTHLDVYKRQSYYSNAAKTNILENYS